MKVKRPSDNRWSHYEFLPSFILGFHGCESEVGESIIRGETSHLAPSESDYDWLGNGIYFWEGSPARALAFAQERAEGGRNSQCEISAPFVLGAVINLRRCLDLADSNAIVKVENAYETLRDVTIARGSELPRNSKGLKARHLDCAVFNWLHFTRAGLHAVSPQTNLPYDTVRGLFWEGRPIYRGAGLRRENHIQICVRNLECILGYFRPTLSNEIP